jgi:hypothetical protein
MDARTGSFQYGSPLRVMPLDCSDPRTSRVAEQACVGGSPQLAVEDDRLGMPSFHLAYGQLGVVSQHGAHTDQDALMCGAQAVGQGHSLEPAQG